MIKTNELLVSVTEVVAEAVGVPTTFAGSLKVLGKPFVEYIKFSRQERVNNFAKCLDLRTDSLTPEQVSEFRCNLESAEGQVVLEQAIEAVARSVSKVIPMALALLLLEDPDFEFATEHKLDLINGMTGASNNLIDFYIALRQNNTFLKKAPYDQYSFSSDQGLIGVFEKFSPEQIYSYIQQLINRALLLPPPETESGGLIATYEDSWYVAYGASKEQKKLMSLLEKAKFMVESTDPAGN